MITIKKAIFCALLCGAALLICYPANAATDDDKKFLANAAQSDVNEIKLSQLAEQKATNPAVKAFAQKMVTEHKQMSASMKSFVEAWGITPPTDLDDDHKDVYKKPMIYLGLSSTRNT